MEWSAGIAVGSVSADMTWGWNSHIDLGRAYWNDCRDWLELLALEPFPDAERLDRLLPPHARSGSGKRLRFVSADRVPGVEYERHIYVTGEVSTRENNWHDLFNALVWCRLPRLKAALNARHHAHLGAQQEGRRGPERDALTLLDESGAIVVSRQRRLLEALARRDWQQAFAGPPVAWSADTRVVICGHALLEKFVTPYQAITAHALLVHADAAPDFIAGDGFLPWLDRLLGRRLMAGLCGAPSALSPLPLMGIPGYWADGPADAASLADTEVFRPAPADLRPAPIHGA